ncbi:putative selenate ABC transporter substrate-binding protein [bacterium]|jgi:phosphonate transport system substrate-binding protein|nr:putative selenate ABC transporter substrate-binding protein [Verrucomicrobiales bacterium]MDB2327211.1 putative selenate ABC transporter substrate-binding protein [bacterium]NCF85280.1 putative selenate ABC transporter substrate-binding protein [Verrucomicrobiaceae bacterium]MDB4772447.1 putative selenate ABC transporter substrate-binding protein [Verrucomicrobiales bacterium]MDC0503783.1 putative selenate ABC transporter substrate-binding protein [Verrucomicrobiales bacterium]
MKFSSIILLGVTAVVVALTGCTKKSPSDSAAGSGAVLKFTAIPDQNKVALQAKFDPVAEYLTEKLGVTCEYVPSTDYSASVQMFEAGDVHIAWFGGLTGVQAMHNVKGARAIAQGLADPNFMSYFIAHKDTGLTASESFPKAMAGKTFTFGSNKSTSGRLMPEYFIRENTGKSPEEFFGQKPGFSGAHDFTIDLVASGQVQVGAVNFKTYDSWAEKAGSDTEACRIIWKTPTYYDYNFTAHPALETLFGDGFTDRLQSALIEMDGALAKSAFNREKLITAKNSDFETIVKVATDLGFLR